MAISVTNQLMLGYRQTYRIEPFGQVNAFSFTPSINLGW